MAIKNVSQTVELPPGALAARLAAGTPTAPTQGSGTPSSGPISGRNDRRDDDAYALHKPHWREGLELLPQHFEAQDSYHERRAAFVLGLLFGQPWGVADLVLNADAMQAGEIAIGRFAAIFPDGTPVSIWGAAGGNALARSFESALRTRETADVYLGLMREFPGRAMVDGGDGSEARRFARSSTERRELATGAKPHLVPWLRPNVRILFEGEAVEEYSILRIARVVRTAQGGAVLHRKLVPPVLRIRASPALLDLVKELEQHLVDTRTALAAQRREGQDSTKSDAARAVLLMMLGRFVPRVGDLLGSNVHPREAYGVFAELLGALSPFGAEGSFAMPRFEFLDLGATFDALATQIHQILAAVTASRYRALPLTRHDDFLRWADLREPGIFGKQFLLVVRGSDPSRVRMEVPRVAKVGASERIGALVSASIPGVVLSAEPHRPAGLDVPAQSVCFTIAQQGDHWDEVMKRGTLGIFLPEPHHRSEITLFVREPGVLE